MNLLDTLTRAADEEQLLLRPLPTHAAATQAEHLRRHYALLLAAVLTAQPAVSEPQTRLLRLLLDALKLGDIRGSLFEQARELTPEPLLEAARLIREAGVAHLLVLDALVLLRLDAPLCDETARLVGELAAFLGLDETELATRARDASDILGLNAGAEVDGEDGVDDSAAGCVPPPAELWPGRLSQPLSVEALRGGLQGGVWVLDDHLDVDFPWQASDAILAFRNGATLNSFTDEGDIKLTGCRLFDAALHFQGGGGSITLERCDWRGDYDPTAKRTALNSNGQALNVADCQFSTRNARAINVPNNSLTLTGSRFTRCGHDKLFGGAVFHSDHERKIENCRFDRCVGYCGGALGFNQLYGVDQCEFVSCESPGLGSSASDLAIYASRNTRNPVLTRCVFRHTSVNVGYSGDGRGRQIAVNCLFVVGNLYYHGNDEHAFSAGSTFDRGSVSERSFNF